MSTYFQWAENHKRLEARVTTHDTVEIPGIMVTEELPSWKDTPWDYGEQEDGSVIMELSPRLEAMIEKLMERQADEAASSRQGPPSSEDRHEWQCVCSACRVDRSEETL